MTTGIFFVRKSQAGVRPSRFKRTATSRPNTPRPNQRGGRKLDRAKLDRAKLDEFAEALAEIGGSIAAIAEHLGIPKRTADRLFQRIRKELGWQAQ